jgi:hypothetical protein
MAKFQVQFQLGADWALKADSVEDAMEKTKAASSWERRVPSPSGAPKT